MPLSVDVRLPRIHPPKFPNRCVHCDGHAPDSTIRVHHNGRNPFFLLIFPVLLAFGWSHVDAPIHASCKRGFRFQAWSRTLLLYVVIFAGILFIGPKVADWSSWLRRTTAVGFLIACSIPIAILETIRPRRFTTTARSDSIDYQFASPSYAAEFRILNEPRRIRKAA